MPELKIYLVEYTCEKTKKRIFHSESLSGLQAMELARNLDDSIVHILSMDPKTFAVSSASQI